MKKQKKENIGVWKIIKNMFPFFWRLTPLLTSLIMIFNVIIGLSFVFITWTQQNFFDIATEFSEGKNTVKALIIALLIFSCAHIINQITNGVSNFLPNVQMPIIHGNLEKKMNEKIGKLSSVEFENTDRLDSINKAINGIDCAIGFTYIFFTILTLYIPYFIFMGIYLFRLSGFLVLLLLFIFIPTIFTQFIRVKVFAKVEDNSAPIRRELDYYGECIKSREYFKETRILGAYTYFKELFSQTLNRLQYMKYKVTLKMGLIELGINVVTVLGYFAILILLLRLLITDRISIGAFIAIFTSIDVMFSLMNEVINGHISAMSQIIGNIRNYINFMNESEEEQELLNENKIDKCSIILKDVSFSYPNCDYKAINNINLTINEGETLAIVGENGAGKSTLVRLIMGIYSADTGQILHDNININTISVSSKFNHISAVFQKYQKYKMTLLENIRIGQFNKEIELKMDNLNWLSDLHIEEDKFPQGLNTILSNEFGGVDLSGGEWQRIAIERGLFRNHKLIILDEPTSAIDPLEETAIYKKFAEIVKDKTAIIVTHRLGSTKLADRIIVMKNGTIVQTGTHNELISTYGEYQQLYFAQEQWYSK